MVIIFLVFWGIFILIAMVNGLIYILTNSVFMVYFAYCLTAFVCVSVLYDIALIHVRWTLNVVLIFISFMANDVEYFFMYLSNICTSFENYLFIHLPIYWLDYLLFQCLIFWVLFVFWTLIPQCMNSWPRFFSI
jgi:hypothetical protein